MTLKIEDVKPGDIICYRNEWYCLIIRKPYSPNLKYIWISGNSRVSEFDKESYRLPSAAIKIADLLRNSTKLAHLDVHTFIGELEKLKNGNYHRTRPASSS